MPVRRSDTMPAFFRMARCREKLDWLISRQPVQARGRSGRPRSGASTIRTRTGCAMAFRISARILGLSVVHATSPYAHMRIRSTNPRHFSAATTKERKKKGKTPLSISRGLPRIQGLPPIRRPQPVRVHHHQEPAPNPRATANPRRPPVQGLRHPVPPRSRPGPRPRNHHHPPHHPGHPPHPSFHHCQRHPPPPSLSCLIAPFPDFCPLPCTFEGFSCRMP